MTAVASGGVKELWHCFQQIEKLFQNGNRRPYSDTYGRSLSDLPLVMDTPGNIPPKAQHLLLTDINHTRRIKGYRRTKKAIETHVSTIGSHYEDVNVLGMDFIMENKVYPRLDFSAKTFIFQ